MGDSAVTIPQWLSIAAPVAAVLSALAAAISASIAFGSNRGAARRDRDSRVRELSLIANRAAAAAIRIEHLADDLKLAYQTRFSFAGPGGTGSSALKLHSHKIEEVKESVAPVKAAALNLLAEKLDSLTDEQIHDRVLEFEAYIARFERVQEQYQFDFAWIEAQNQLYRAKAVNWDSQYGG